MEPFSESELFDEDMPAASPLSVEQSTEALRPSATGGWSAIAALAHRWPGLCRGLAGRNAGRRLGLPGEQHAPSDFGSAPSRSSSSTAQAGESPTLSRQARPCVGAATGVYGLTDVAHSMIVYFSAIGVDTLPSLSVYGSL